MNNLVNTVLQDRYFLRQLVGSGGMADVYLAWDRMRASQMAIKVLRPDLANDERAWSTFKEEAHFLQELRHPNIVRFYDVGQDGNLFFIVMEWVDGADLKRAIQDRKQPFNADEAGQILAPLSRALHFAHQSKAYHCDIKPANVLIRKADNEVFLTDFGVSRWKFDRRGGGTPAYMAPELFTGANVTERTEVYAVGITLYEMLSGALPFRGESKSPGSTSRERIAWEHNNAPLPSLQQANPSLPAAVVTVIQKALNKDSKQRFANIMNLLTAFDNARSGASPAKPAVVDANTILAPVPDLPESTRPPTPKSPIRPVTPAKKAGQPHLFAVTGEHARNTITIPRDGLGIGRSRSNQLVLSERSVSRQHATILCTRRAFYIRDENSSLGTYLNGRRISAGGTVVLSHGDRITIASQVFEFRAE